MTATIATVFVSLLAGSLFGLWMYRVNRQPFSAEVSEDWLQDRTRRAGKRGYSW